MKKLDKNIIEDILPLTPMQEGMLFHYLKKPGSDLYFEQLSLSITGNIDDELFKKSWDVVVRTNEMLRTSFRWEGVENPLQIVLKEQEVQPQYYDLSGNEINVASEILEEIKNKDRKKSFDLQEIPSRIILCKIRENKYEMILSYHHILYDGWSNGILLQEFFSTYYDLYRGKELIKPGKAKFKDFIKWVQNQDKKEQEKSWKDYLKGFEAQAGLPFKRKKEKESPTGRAGNLQKRFELDVETRENIEDFVKEHGITLASFLFGAWGILLLKYHNCYDVIFGTTVSGRSARLIGIEETVGLFINTLPLRVLSHSHEKITGLLHRIDEVRLLREPYESTSLADIKKYSDFDNREELFDSVFVLENYPLKTRLAGNDNRFPLSIDSYSMVERTHYDLTIVVEVLDGIQFTFNFDKETFAEDSAARLTHHFRSVLQEMTGDPGKDISQIEIISREEKKQLLRTFNDTGADFPKDKTIAGLLARQVERTPDNIAVLGPLSKKSGTNIPYMIYVSYRELNEKSGQLASLLKENGVGQETIVGIMMERSLAVMIAIFGVLKAGGIYMPIDPGYPPGRIHYMLADSRAGLVITDNAIVENDEIFRWLKGKKKNASIRADRELSLYSIFSLHLSTACYPPAASLAYVIYTSGSTGKPKGVMIEHRSLVNRLNWMQKSYPLGGGDVILQKTPMVFDVSLWELFWWSFQGASLCLLGPGEEKNPTAIVEAVNRGRVTTLHFVPAMLNAFLEYLEQSGSFDLKALSSLKQIFSSGEALLTHHVKRFNLLLNKTNGTRLINLYGPTEAAVDVSYYDCPGDECHETIPIGKPIDNIKLYIVDKDLNLQPLEVAGELCISGVGLARGYLNKPESTTEKFIENYFYGTNRTYIKLYKTGDLARWLSDGNIEYLGRIDHQVKIRGFRIELGEIENRLITHPDIKETVVIARDMENKGNKEKYLCAYFVSEYPPDTGALKEFLARALPGYMIPSYFVHLDKIPLTANGKVDIKALPLPVYTVSKAYEPPRDEIEKKLAEIWSAVLGIASSSIGIDDNFFQWGGHSLTAIRLVSRIHKELNIIVPISQLFKFPTVREIAGHINKASQEIYSAVKLTEKKDYYVLSSAQKRLYILHQVEKVNTGYNMTQVLELEGEVNSRQLEKTFRRLIERHESFRTFFFMAADTPVQRIHDEVAFEIENLATEAAGDTEDKNHHSSFIIDRFVRTFDLSKTPLLRVGLREIGEKKHLLLVDMHHIISDGISTGILIKDFMALWAGEELLPLMVNYKDFSHWQGSKYWREAVKDQETYWLRQFGGDIPVLELPTDFPRPVVQQFEGRRLTFEVGKEETAALQTTALRQETTLYMVISAILSIFLAKISNQEDIVIGTPTAGRRHADLENIIGMFVNTLVLRYYPTGEKAFAAYLDDVKESTLEAFENQDYPFEELVEKLVLPRDTGRNPLFDVMFVLQDLDIPVIEIPGLTLTPLEYDPVTAKFDLTFICEKTAGDLLFSVEYSTKLFKESTIRRFIRYFKNIAARATGEPAVKISEVELMSAEEREEILVDFNNTKTNYPAEKTIHRLFEEQAAKTPDRTALVEAAPRGCPVVTYRELNEKSGGMARLLQERGVGPDNIAGIMAERSIKMIIGILGILKTGGAYLPIDPEYPSDRIDFMLKDSGAKTLVSDRNNLVTGHCSVTILDLIHAAHGEIGIQKLGTRQNDSTGTGQCPVPMGSHLTHLTQPTHQNLAYIIYTSGSTGKPKGVMIEHPSVINRLNWMQKYYPLGRKDIILQKTTFTFDVSVWELFWWSWYGASLYLLKPKDEASPGAIAEATRQAGITTLHFVPSMLNFFLGYLESEGEMAVKKLTSLRQVFSSGEALLTNHVQRFYRLLPKAKLVNLYGPTEATVDVSYYDCPAEIPGEIVPIGKPIDNIQLYVLDKNMHLQPVGIPGELGISGVGLARGYLNRPGLTAEKFVKVANDRSSHPIAPIPHSPIYRTGDWVRWLPDGNIEFLGRTDHQVKVRGKRIELGEVESWLLKHPQVKEAVITAKETGNEESHLAAYIVPIDECPHSTGSPGLNVSGIRKYLAGHLPAYMIPSYFIKLSHLPLTSNGKLNRKALPQPAGLIETGVDYVTPASEVEKKIAYIWKEVLNRDKVSVMDSFFDLGGTSIKIIQANNKLKEVFGRDIPIINMFRYTTISALAEHLSETGGRESIQAAADAAPRDAVETRGENRMKNLKKIVKQARN